MLKRACLQLRSLWVQLSTKSLPKMFKVLRFNLKNIPISLLNRQMCHLQWLPTLFPIKTSSKGDPKRGESTLWSTRSKLGGGSSKGSQIKWPENWPDIALRRPRFVSACQKSHLMTTFCRFDSLKSSDSTSKDINMTILGCWGNLSRRWSIKTRKEAKLKIS